MSSANNYRSLLLAYSSRLPSQPAFKTSTLHATLFALSTLFAVAFAAPGGNTGATCSTGPVQCCNTVTTANNPVASTVLGLVGVALQNLNVGIGLACSPISGVGAGGGTW